MATRDTRVVCTDHYGCLIRVDEEDQYVVKLEGHQDIPRDYLRKTADRVGVQRRTEDLARMNRYGHMMAGVIERRGL